MDYPATVDAILTHAKASGAYLDNPIDDVAYAFPAPTPSRCIRVFYGGETEPEKMGANRVLNGELIAETIVITAFWPLSNLRESYAETTLNEVRELKHQLKTRIFGDSQLGGQTTDLSLGYATVEYSLIGGAPYVVLTIEAMTDFVEYTIAT